LQGQAEEEAAKKLEEERKKREEKEEEKELQRIESAEKRDHPHIYLWLKCKVSLLWILFHQKRFEDCEDFMVVLERECKSVND